MNDIKKIENIGESTFFEIDRLMRILAKANHLNKDALAEKIRERCHEMPLSIQVRSGWHTLQDEMVAEEFEILLVWGGPAVRITGKLDEHKEPSTATLEGQDWFTPWTRTTGQDPETVLEFARLFFFGE